MRRAPFRSTAQGRSKRASAAGKRMASDVGRRARRGRRAALPLRRRQNGADRAAASLGRRDDEEGGGDDADSRGDKQVTRFAAGLEVCVVMVQRGPGAGRKSDEREYEQPVQRSLHFPRADCASNRTVRVFSSIADFASHSFAVAGNRLKRDSHYIVIQAPGVSIRYFGGQLGKCHRCQQHRPVSPPERVHAEVLLARR
jgi:hypothetical protein